MLLLRVVVTIPSVVAISSAFWYSAVHLYHWVAANTSKSVPTAVFMRSVSQLVQDMVLEPMRNHVSSSVLSFASRFGRVAVSRCLRYMLRSSSHLFICRTCLRCPWCLMLRSGRQVESRRVHLDSWVLPPRWPVSKGVVYVWSPMVHCWDGT